MSYEAVVCKVVPFKHPNADRLQVVMCEGVPVIVGADVKEGDVGVYFPEDGKLSDMFCKLNDLYARYDEDGKKINSGYINSNGQVTAQKIRGVKSYGLWMPLSSINFGGTVELKDGDRFTSVPAGVKDGGNVYFLVCEKYISPQTKRAMERNAADKKNSSTREHPSLPQHPDTAKWANVVDMLPEDALYTVTLKLHGTSQRSAKIEEYVPRFKWFPWFFKKKVETLIHGTRRVPKRVFSEPYRQAAGSLFEWLPVGWAAYYEIVGYQSEHSLIHGAVSTAGMDKEIRKKYGDKMAYTYGCKPGEHGVYVYNLVDDLGNAVSQYDLERLCEQNFVDSCPVILRSGTKEQAMISVDAFTDGHDLIDSSHIREGVVVRVDSKDGSTRFYKSKSHDFLVGEGVAKAAGEVDTEEAQG